MTRIPIFAANWKMNKLLAEVPEFVSRLSAQLADIPKELGKDYEVVIAPPALHLTKLHEALKGGLIRSAAQNSGPAKSGAFTGEISPVMLKEAGVEWVILGHSERRHIFKEDNALVLSRLKAAVEEKLHVILCVGELLEERKAGKTFTTIETQLAILKQGNFPADALRRLVIAYEPVWAIGTGENATPQQAQEVHAHIRRWLAENISAPEAAAMRILYGGSVKPDNSGSLCAQADVDGLLVGGASLDPATFAGIIRNGLTSRA